MKQVVNRWHYISVYLAGATALIAIFWAGDVLQKLLLASIVVLFLHFFEEFGFPGGFPAMAMKALMGSAETDSSKWSINNLSSMFGNWGFLLFVYVAPLLLPGVAFLTLSVMIFSVAEILMHAILFNLKGRTLYNPGAITGVLGLGPIACYYFVSVFDPSSYAWYEYVFAVAWFGFIFWLTFRSPLYWRIGRVKGYRFTDQTAYGIHYADHAQKSGEADH